MMKPKISHGQDIIDALLERSWENPPPHLKHQLQGIPAKIDVNQNRNLDLFTSFLNAILVLWGIGLITYFWAPLATSIRAFSTSILGYSSLSPELLAHPILPGVAFVCLVAGWAWLDLEKYPRGN